MGPQAGAYSRREQHQRGAAGTAADGIPYNRFGSGPRPLVVFTGLTFENKPASGLEARFTRSSTRFLEDDYTVWVLNRRAGLAPGTSIADLADDYAAHIGSEFGGPVDLIGISTGGSIALEFALDHPELVRRLVVYSAAARLGEHGRRLQRRIGRLAARREWGRVMMELLSEVLLPRTGVVRTLAGPAQAAFWLLGRFTLQHADPSDAVITIAAEDAFDVTARLGKIRVPVLVVGGVRDPFYDPGLFELTARRIPDGRLHLEPAGGHVPMTPAAQAAIREFLADAD